MTGKISKPNWRREFSEALLGIGIVMLFCGTILWTLQNGYPGVTFIIMIIVFLVGVIGFAEEEKEQQKTKEAAHIHTATCSKALPIKVVEQKFGQTLMGDFPPAFYRPVIYEHTQCVECGAEMEWTPSDGWKPILKS